jgi:hypothetical protein
LRPVFFVIVVLSTWLGQSRGWGAEFSKDWARMKFIVPQGYVCYHTTGPLQIDGRLDKADWQRAAWTRDFQDIEGDAKPAPRFRTRAKMLWDERYFYVGAELEEPHVWATLTNHDAVIFRDNDFEVFIDPNGDSHEYYEIEINALNAEWDLLLKKPYKDGGPALNEWEIPGLKTAVHVQGTLNDPSDVDRGWSVELAFPWEVLREYAHCPAPPREGDQWRVNFSRVEWQIQIANGKNEKVPGKPEDNWVWSPQGIVDMHRPEKWGYVQFTEKAPGTVSFAPDPALPARNALQEIYYAQRDYRTLHQHWAERMEDLNLARDFDKALAKPPVLKATPDGFEATAEIRLTNGKTQRWHIREDANVWND